MKYKMTLKHVPNIDIYGGYWDEPIDKKPLHISKERLKEMRDAFIKWKERNGLGGGNVPPIFVFKDGKRIGEFSYNARFWKYNKHKGE